MGYTISIVRRSHEGERDEESKITLDEWLSHIDNANDLERPGESSMTDYNREYYRNRPGYCEWTGHSRYKEPFARPAFDYYNGQVIAENVDNETLSKMMIIAEALGAVVQGQDGEFFDEDDPIVLQPASDPVFSPIQLKKPWWRFW